MTDFDYRYRRFQQPQLIIQAALQLEINREEEPVETQMVFKCPSGLSLSLLLPGHDVLPQE